MIRVLCVEDDPLMLCYLVTRLNAEPGIQVVATAPDVERALLHLGRQEVDVVLLDYVLPGNDGMRLVRAMAPWQQYLTACEGHPAILFCTGAADSDLYARARLAGARGVVAKERIGRDLIPAVHAVVAGRCWFDEAGNTPR